jgi:DNA-binding HxlR family transcriptional regulator
MQHDDDHCLRTIERLTSRKWTLPVLYVLSNETLRYHEIHAALPGITQKMLTDTLRKLEDYSFINRVVYPSVPPKVEYNLTDLGGSFVVAFSSVIEWAKTSIQEIDSPAGIAK